MGTTMTMTFAIAFAVVLTLGVLALLASADRAFKPRRRLSAASPPRGTRRRLP